LAWTQAGRTSPPRLVALAYAGIGDVEQTRANVYYYRATGDEIASLVAASTAGGIDAITQRVAEFEELGADELILLPAVTDLDEVSRRADAVL
jgi:hypothetical protein